MTIHIWLIMEELGRFNFKVNVIPNGLEKCVSFNINNQLVFIVNFLELLSSLLDSLFRNLSNDFKYLKQKKFYNNASDLVKQKGFYPYE